MGTGGLSLNGASGRQREELLLRAKTSNGRDGAPVLDVFFRDCLALSGLAAMPDDRVYQIDARPFHDPDHGRRRVSHFGLSGPMLLAMAEDPAFGRWFFDHVRAIAAEAQALRGSGRLHVVSFCRSGRRRSVALASLLEQLLAKFTSWPAMTENLASHAWQWRTCNLCDACRCPPGEHRRAGERARALAEASFRWAFWYAAVGK